MQYPSCCLLPSKGWMDRRTDKWRQHPSGSLLPLEGQVDRRTDRKDRYYLIVPFIFLRKGRGPKFCLIIACSGQVWPLLNTLRPRQNGRHFPNNIFKCIFLNENIWILIEISLKFVTKGPINNIPALVPIMAWRRPGEKPLSELMLVSPLTLICVSRPQWVNSSPLGQYGRHFVDNIFRCIFVNEEFGILIKISLKFVPKDPIDNKPALF